MLAKPKGQQYKPGERVRHDKFGEGIILKSEMEQDTEFVEVQFQGKHGKKRLSMDFAKLEKYNCPNLGNASLFCYFTLPLERAGRSNPVII